MRISVSALPRPGGDFLELEIIERKGTGHPDTICDQIAEEFSLALSRHYLSEFGEILHHNVDKALLAAGASQPEIGGGRIVAPIRLFLAGRATERVGSKTIPVGELGKKAALDRLGRHFPRLDLEHHIEVRSLVHPGSVDLNNLFARRSSGGRRLANDTSCGVGYLKPLSESFDGLCLAFETAPRCEQTLTAKSCDNSTPIAGSQSLWRYR